MFVNEEEYDESVGILASHSFDQPMTGPFWHHLHRSPVTHTVSGSATDYYFHDLTLVAASERRGRQIHAKRLHGQINIDYHSATDFVNAAWQWGPISSHILVVRDRTGNNTAPSLNNFESSMPLLVLRPGSVERVEILGSYFVTHRPARTNTSWETTNYAVDPAVTINVYANSIASDSQLVTFDVALDDVLTFPGNQSHSDTEYYVLCWTTCPHFDRALTYHINHTLTFEDL